MHIHWPSESIHSHPHGGRLTTCPVPETGGAGPRSAGARRNTESFSLPNGSAPWCHLNDCQGKHRAGIGRNRPAATD